VVVLQVLRAPQDRGLLIRREIGGEGLRCKHGDGGNANQRNMT
jgi:hypothetical protein